MFNGGVPDQLHQFIASSRPNSVVSLLPLSTTNTITTTPFSSNSSIDNIHANYTPNHAHESHHHHHHHLLHHQLLPPLHHPNFLHPMLHHVQQQQQQHHHPKLNHHLHHHQKDIDEQAAAATGPNSLVSEVDLEMMETHTPIPELIPTVDHHHHHNHHHSHHPHPHPHLQPWSEDEVLALLGIRSTMENWFPDFTWEHVSRKLAELGFKRSAEKCKEKFEEESQYFNNNNNNNCSKSYSRICTQLSELEELYHGESQVHHHQHQNHHNGTAVNEKDQRVEENPSELDVKIRDINNGHHRQSLEELEISDSTRNETVVLLGGNSKEYYSDETEKVVVVGVEIAKSGNIENNKQNNDSNNNNNNNNKSSKKRKRSSSSSSSSHENYNKMKFDMFKGFCEEIVKKMMAQQEEMHNKLLEDMVKRDQEKVAIEEAWKKQEIDRMNKELETMAHEQAVAGDRQASIIDFLNKVTCSNSAHESTQFSKLSNKDNNNNKEVSLTNSSSSSSLVLLHQPHEQNIPPPANPTITHLEKNQTNHHHHTQYYDQQQQQPSSSSSPSHHHHHQKTSSGISKDIIVAVSSTTHLANKPTATSPPNKTIQNPTSINDKEDLGKRWPRDEVLALINLRCNLYSTATTTTTATAGESSDHHKEGMLVSSSTSPSSVKAPLWERISQGMLELGYKRSAKRCKEKWENINKYFRKTKDANKKRSVDSRTCPYFHQLSSLYNKGATTTLVSVSSSQGQNNNDHHQDHIVINNDDHHSPSSVVVLPEISTAIATASRQLIIDESTTPADDDHNHDSTQLHIDQGERSSSVNNIIIHDHHHHHHQEVAVVASAAFDFEF
ncbi:trihelix transcription factor GTL2 [Humulus lupulus]|uniref:trihelix transcription factor GTL2 n=1 Tax=Humulus lupulus TaxID=3486 RepID=UPI002B411E01|nr:trihelix transcription factor GTL2 [Humulus lupulus]